MGRRTQRRDCGGYCSGKGATSLRGSKDVSNLRGKSGRWTGAFVAIDPSRPRSCCWVSRSASSGGRDRRKRAVGEGRDQRATPMLTIGQTAVKIDCRIAWDQRSAAWSRSRQPSWSKTRASAVEETGEKVEAAAAGLTAEDEEADATGERLIWRMRMRGGRNRFAMRGTTRRIGQLRRIEGSARSLLLRMRRREGHSSGELRLLER